MPAPRRVNTASAGPSNLGAHIKPAWFAWLTRHPDETDPRAIFAAGFLMGGGSAVRLSSSLAPHLQDAATLLLWMTAAAEQVEGPILRCPECGCLLEPPPDPDAKPLIPREGWVI